MAEITFVQIIDSENGDTASLRLFADGAPLVTFTYHRSTARVDATALAAPVELEFDNYRAIVRQIGLLLAHADAHFGTSAPRPRPKLKSEYEIDRTKPTPCARKATIAGQVLVDVEWNTVAVKVKARPAFDLDRSGFEMFVDEHERFVGAVQDYLLGL